MAKEKEKKDKKNCSGKLLVTILVVLLFGVFLGFGFALGGVNIINKVKDGNTVVTTGTDNNADYTEIPVDSMIENLYERTKAVSFGIDRTRYGNKKLLVSEMSAEYKGLIAAHYFMRFAEFYQYDFSHHLREADVQYAYDSIFGAGTYKPGQTIYTGCGNYTYDSAKKEYITNEYGCGGTSAQTAFEEIVEAQRNSNNLKITTGVIFATSEGYFKSYDDMDDSSKAFNYTSGPNNEAEYILSNRDSLTQITYTFEVDTNGFYKYVGSERTQEAK